jgi:hypothetical protein
MEHTKKQAIGATEYTFLRCGAREGLALRARLIKVVAPLVLAVVGGKADAKLSEIEVSPAMLGNIGQALAGGLDSAEVVAVVDGLMKAVLIGGRPGETAWDAHFAGNYGDLDKVIVEAIKHNGFFGQLGAALSRLPS